MLTPLSVPFNVAALHIAGRLWPKGFDVSADAPATFEDMVANFKATGRHVVWSGASDRTIFGDPEVNYAFRAWHDWHHISRSLDFSDASEHEVFAGQYRDVRGIYGNGEAAQDFCDLLYAEIIGQLEFKNRHGNFPADQRGFVRHYLASPTRAVDNHLYA